jgi:hypothetical protein
MWKMPVVRPPTRTVSALLLALAAITPRVLLAQDEIAADFTAAHAQFASGQVRPAANTLIRSTLYVRQQVGRSKDEVVGMQLLSAESDLEKLAGALRGGREMTLKAFDAELQRVDRLLAQHFVQMAVGAIAHPRTEDSPLIAKDIRRGAFHYERTITLDGRTPAADIATLLSDVRTLATDIETTRSIPKSAAVTLAVFEKQITGAAVMAVSQR